MQPSGGAPAVAPLAVWQALAVEEWDAAAAAALTEALRAAGEDAANAVYSLDGETLPLLQHAVHMESLDKVKLLLREGARPDEIDTSDDESAEERESALHLAAHMKAQDPAFNAQVMEALLDALASQLHGAQVRWLHRHEDPRLQHYVQEEAAHAPRCTPTLQDCVLQVDVDAVRDGKGKTPLALAVQRFHTMFAQSRGAEADAAEAGASRVVALLLERGSSVAAVDATGESVLHGAAEWAPASCLARILGSASCTPLALNAADARGAAPLHRALALGRGGTSPPDNAAVLLQRGAALAPPSSERHAHGATAALRRFLHDAPRQEGVCAHGWRPAPTSTLSLPLTLTLTLTLALTHNLALTLTLALALAPNPYPKTTANPPHLPHPDPMQERAGTHQECGREWRPAHRLRGLRAAARASRRITYMRRPDPRALARAD
jgi:ankyrin repeat protein